MEEEEKTKANTQDKKMGKAIVDGIIDDNAKVDALEIMFFIGMFWINLKQANTVSDMPDKVRDAIREQNEEQSKRSGFSKWAHAGDIWRKIF